MQKDKDKTSFKIVFDLTDERDREINEWLSQFQRKKNLVTKKCIEAFMNSPEVDELKYVKLTYKKKNKGEAEKHTSEKKVLPQIKKTQGNKVKPEVDNPIVEDEHVLSGEEADMYLKMSNSFLE